VPDIGDPAEASGEALDLERLVEAHSADLYRFATWLVRDPHAAEDLVQETFLRAYQARDRYRGTRSR